jgi:hypothetical protein
MGKSKMSFMKIIIVIMICFTPVLTNAQTFKCTSVKFSDEVSTSEQLKLKERSLGAKMECKFFETDIKVTLSYNYKGELKKEVSLFVKEDNIYRNDHRWVLNMEKSLGFITKINLLQYNFDDKYEGTFTFERELF